MSAHSAVSPISPARSAAFDILLRVATSAAHSDDLLHGPRLAGLTQVDRDLAMTLVLGVLRWLIALDARIVALLSRPDAELPEPVAMALRLGAFQLLYLERIPAHAALNESVELVRAAGHGNAAGMVNAVLRQLTRMPPPRRPLVESTAAMAERLGHPRWLAERWVRHYGRSAAEAMCAFDQQEPACSAIFALDADDPALPVMDAGSRLVAEIAASLVDREPLLEPETAKDAQHRRVWDCCAAPGGKTMVLAARLPGVTILATDQSPRRTQRLKERLAGRPLSERVQVVEADAALLPASYGNFDLILCDVPCSGTGTLARNPEVRHRLRADDLRRQAERQMRLLTAALQRLKPGGSLVYSTCSLEPEECEEIVRAAIAAAGEPVELQPVQHALQLLEVSGRLQAGDTDRWTAGMFLRTLPGVGFQGDGFFAAILCKRPGSGQPLRGEAAAETA